MLMGAPMSISGSATLPTCSRLHRALVRSTGAPASSSKMQMPLLLLSTICSKIASSPILERVQRALDCSTGSHATSSKMQTCLLLQNCY